MVKTYFDHIFKKIEDNHPNDTDTSKALKDVIISLAPVFEQNNHLIYQGILDRLIEENPITGFNLPSKDSALTMDDEAKGHSLVYFLKEMLSDNALSMAGKTAVVSGSDDPACHAMDKLQSLGVKILACSDGNGVIHDPYGIDLALVTAMKDRPDGTLEQYIFEHPDAIYIRNAAAIWDIPCHIALTCTPSTHIDIAEAETLIRNGCIAVAEGTAFTATPDAVLKLHAAGLLFCPANTAVTRNMIIDPAAEALEEQLETLIKETYQSCKKAAQKYGCKGNLTAGVNIALFEKSTTSMNVGAACFK